MKSRVFAPALVLLALFALELVLGRALLEREPLQAILTGRIWVAAILLAALATRLLLILLAPAWLVAACVGSWFDRRAGSQG